MAFADALLQRTHQPDTKAPPGHYTWGSASTCPANERVPLGRILSPDHSATLDTGDMLEAMLAEDFTPYREGGA